MIGMHIAHTVSRDRLIHMDSYFQSLGDDIHLSFNVLLYRRILHGAHVALVLEPDLTQNCFDLHDAFVSSLFGWSATLRMRRRNMGSK